ncbi:hypothetical protein GpartN1_g2178.t1 [Galdieria partita]|uniref:Uncharacterized protein n=1 Tax=Galdieria partita TaxID=83374 RepID=A0A9C7UPD7_9RHOD|nr:hypothetical protein GpartN1_g2178.t1 [Galdieria partita]
MKIQQEQAYFSSKGEQNKPPPQTKKPTNSQNVYEIGSEKDTKLSDNFVSSFQPNEQALQSILSGTGIAFSALEYCSGKNFRLTDSKLPLPRRMTIAGRSSLFQPRRQRIETLQNGETQDANTEQTMKDSQSSSNCTDNIPEREVKDKENQQSFVSPNSKDVISKSQSQTNQDEQPSLDPKYEQTTSFKTETASEFNKNSQLHKNKGRAKRKEQQSEKELSSKVSYCSEQNEYGSTILSDGANLNTVLFNAASSVSQDWKYFGTVIQQLLDLHANDEKRIKELEHENVLLLNRITNCEREAASEREATRREIQQLHTELSKSENEIRNLQEEIREQKRIYKEQTDCLKNQVELLQNKANLDEKASSILNVGDDRYSRLQQVHIKSMGEDSKVSATSNDIDNQPISKDAPISSKRENIPNYGLEATISKSTNNIWEPLQVQQATVTSSPCSTRQSFNSHTPSSSNRGKLFREPKRDIFSQASGAANSEATKLDIPGSSTWQMPSKERVENFLSASFEVQPQSLQQILSCEGPTSSQTIRGAARYMSFYEPTFKPDCNKEDLREVEEEADWRRLTLTAETANNNSLLKSTQNSTENTDKLLDPCNALLSSLREELRGPRYRNMRDAWQNLFKPTCNRLKPSLFYQAIRKIPAGKQVSQDVLDELFQRIVPAAKEIPKDSWEDTMAMGWEHFVRLYQGSWPC